MSDVFARMLAPADADARFYGVSVGVVTNTQDPKGLGRVRFRLPWMADTVESAWARVAAGMAGPDCGLYFLPAVDDEVLVAFEHGCPEFPYVLGALWNGRDTPPVANGDGRNEVRMIRSRRGLTIRLTDTEDDEKIEIVDRKGSSIVISSADGSVTVTAKGPLRLAGAGVEISSTAGIRIEADAQLDLKGLRVGIN